jgi:(1->4)-alpha-D-glucan 1-alpha-D-glucosylmutase
MRPRLREYLLKAAREAKRHTTWTEPNAAYESALMHFVDAVLEPAADAPFLPDLARFVALIADASFWIGAARTLLHLTSPGTPDLYQGAELSSAFLVDPDNRRPVDYGARAAVLEALTDAPTGTGPTLAPADAGARLRLIARVLATRRAASELFASGSYVPLEVEGLRRRNVIAVARTRGAECALVVAPRLLGARAHAPCDGAWWSDTRLVVPTHLRDAFARQTWQDALAGTTRRSPLDALGEVPIASVFSEIPLALFICR